MKFNELPVSIYFLLLVLAAPTLKATEPVKPLPYPSTIFDSSTDVDPNSSALLKTYYKLSNWGQAAKNSLNLAINDITEIPEKKCRALEKSSAGIAGRMPKPSPQLIDGTCWAKATASLLSESLCAGQTEETKKIYGDTCNKEISELDVARCQNELYFDLGLHTDKARLKKLLSADGNEKEAVETRMKNFLLIGGTFERGLTCATQGVCADLTDKELPKRVLVQECTSFSDIHSQRKCLDDFFNRSLDGVEKMIACKNFLLPGEEKALQPILDIEKLFGGKVSYSTLREMIKSSDNFEHFDYKFLYNLRACSRSRFSNSDLFPSLRRDPKGKPFEEDIGGRLIEEGLSKGRPVGISVSFPLYSKEAARHLVGTEKDVELVNDGHALLIIGARWNEGKKDCELNLFNSMGEEGDSQPFQGWKSAKYVLEGVVKSTYIKK